MRHLVGGRARGSQALADERLFEVQAPERLRAISQLLDALSPVFNARPSPMGELRCAKLACDYFVQASQPSTSAIGWLTCASTTRRFPWSACEHAQAFSCTAESCCGTCAGDAVPLPENR